MALKVPLPKFVREFDPKPALMTSEVAYGTMNPPCYRSVSYRSNRVWGVNHGNTCS